MFVSANDSAVVLQYHHVSDETPPETSVTPLQFVAHLDWLRDNHFTVLPLLEIVKSLKAKKGLQVSKAVAITFDDGAISVCQQAWPELKKRKLPFTMFVNPEAIEKKYSSHCSWKELKEMARSPLVTIANHSYSHLHMVSKENLKQEEWSRHMEQEVNLAQSLIEKNLGQAPALFAYPYGEFNKSLADMLRELGYVAFGQQSGPIGFNSDWTALPRFSGSGKYGRLETLSVKLMSRPFPLVFEPVSDNPIALLGQDNPPKLLIHAGAKETEFFHSMSCFNGAGEPIILSPSVGGGSSSPYVVQAPAKLKMGRHRYTCTRPSAEVGRYYWFSHQWIVE